MNFEQTIDREVLLYAVQRAIFYPHCSHTADVRDAALVTYTMTSEAMERHGVDQGTYVTLLHTACVDMDVIENKLKDNDDAESYEIIDGRKFK